MSEFKIKSYGLTELAQLYRPDVQPKSALATLHKWIDQNTELKAGLAQTGFNPKESHCLTPMQVKIIVYYLGEP